MSAPDFDWDREDEVVVVQEQAAVAVYKNHRDCIVIRQKGDWYGHEDDVWVVIEPDRAERVAHAILALVEPEKPLALPAPSGNAERQRRYRERHRNGPTVTGDRNDTVTADRDSNAETDLFVGEPARGGGR